MAQDEVDLIYNYLHKYYEYLDGDLIRRLSGSGRAQGAALGTFSFIAQGKAPVMKSVIVVNKKRFASTLSRFIWIFHYKKCPIFLEFIDGSPVNCRIENLREIDATQQYLKNTEKCKGISKIENSKGIAWRASLHKNEKIIFLGHHKTKEEANIAYKFGREALSKKIYSIDEIKNYVNLKLGKNVIPINKNKTGFKGVRKTKEGSYLARFQKKGKRIETKCYKTPEEAHAAYLKAKMEFTGK